MQEDDEGDKSATTGGPFSPRIGILPMWRARCITPYNPELLPPEAVPLQEEVSYVIDLIPIPSSISYHMQTSNYIAHRAPRRYSRSIKFA